VRQVVANSLPLTVGDLTVTALGRLVSASPPGVYWYARASKRARKSKRARDS
jgi:hypothetical protein